MPKRIVIFADGTGNAFSQQESNVWRLYEALDKTNEDQIVYYVKGVGTSGFRPYAIIDGATGIGVPANVRAAYEFICWNWSPGDEIYLFGFSRGAFTIRTLVGLIHYEGLVPTRIGPTPVYRAEMKRNVMAAWRSYRAKTAPGKSAPTFAIVRAIRDVLVFIDRLLLGRRSYRQVNAANRKSVPIKFVGLFDTVEAYGVPVEELRVAIDRAMWPISFRNRVLSPLAERACHALSLDDERETFHPLRFDMTQETTDRIQEVWFAGAHSDVGGGYPDGSLALVPLLWMAENAAAPTVAPGGATTPGLRFTRARLDEFRQAASALGPRHDSRSGWGVFYRYSPRTIGRNERGDAPVVHYSVAEKMVFGCERYAPIGLPSVAHVLLPDTSVQAISGFQPSIAARAQTTIDAAMASALAALERIKNPRRATVQVLRDFIWWRRVGYFALLLATLILIALPISAGPLTHLAEGAGESTAQVVGAQSIWAAVWEFLVHLAGAITALLVSILIIFAAVIPGYAKPYTDVVTAWPIVCILVIAIVLLLYRANGWLRDRIGDLAREAWFPTAAGPALNLRARKSVARFMRQSAAVNGLVKAFSTYVLPGVGVIAIYCLILIAFSRGLFSVYEGHGNVCRPSKTEPPVLSPGQAKTLNEEFSTDRLCWATGVKLEKGRKYSLRFDMTQPYFDADIITDVAGFTDKWGIHLLGVPIRRWWSADWFQPVARIGTDGDTQWPLVSAVGESALPEGSDRAGATFESHVRRDPVFRSKFPDATQRASGAKLSPEELSVASQIRAAHEFSNTFVSEFIAPEDGELFLYVNDAVVAAPFWGVIKRFYENNTGRAKVSIRKWSNPSVQ
jgi:T6SS, Phospholipase effector Tle1-like, catalytic domain